MITEVLILFLKYQWSRVMEHKTRILIVEDEALNTEFIVSGLKRYGFSNFKTAVTSAAGLKLCSEERFDVALLDVTLEETYSGIALAKEIDRLYRIPVIFITGRSDDEMVERIEETNMFGVLFKPYKIQSLKLLIKAALANAALLHAAERSAQKLEDQVRKVHTFLAVARLMGEQAEVKTIIRKALPIIPGAFKLGKYLRIRITYKGMLFLSEGFKKTKWVLSEALGSEKGNLVELYLDYPDQVTKFPFSLEEIETFSSVIKQLSLTIEKVEMDSLLQHEYSHQEFFNALLGELLAESDINIESFTKIILRGIAAYSHVGNASVFTFHLGAAGVRQFSLHKDPDWNSEVTIPLSLDLRKCLKKKARDLVALSGDNPDSLCTEYESLQQLERGVKKTILASPFRIRDSLVALLVFETDSTENEKITQKDITALQNIFTLGIQKVFREKKIAMYFKAIEQNPASVVITDPDGTITFINPAFLAITGYRKDEVIGQNPRVLKSGEMDETFYKTLWDTILSGHTWRGEFHNKKKDGTLYWESASISPIKEADGTITGFIGVKEDITEKVKAEQKLREVNRMLKDTQSSLVMEEKLASIGRLAAGVAHEINNPVGFISSNFRTIKRYYEKYRSFLKEIQAESSLTRDQLKTAVQKYKLDLVEEDMNDLLNESEDGFKRVINIVNSLRSFSRVDQMKARVKYDFNEA